MTIVVMGRSGQVATALAERAAASAIPLRHIARPTVDFAAPETIVPALESAAPEIVVNAAAYTAVDAAESDADTALAVNGVAPGVIAAWCAAHGARLIHISTDYVFDGNGTRPYREDDPVGPQSVYGRTKLAGEEAVRAAGGQALILRTAWVYAPFGKNFVRTMLRLGAERDTLRVVADQVGKPTSALDIADAILALCKRAAQWEDGVETFHLAGSGITSWHGFAEEILRLASLKTAVQAIKTSQFPTAAARPRYSVLDCEKIAARHNVVLPPWRVSVENVVERIR